MSSTRPTGFAYVDFVVNNGTFSAPCKFNYVSHGIIILEAFNEPATLFLIQERHG
jgi:hypothetical protein